LKIVELTAYQVRIPLRKRIRHASYERKTTDNVVVRCLLDDGTAGYGEGVPRDYVTGETIDSVFTLLQRSDLAGQLQPANDLASTVEVARNLKLAPVPGDDRQRQGNAARCAVELAYLDAMCRHLRQPLSNATRIAQPELCQPSSRVRYGAAVTGARGNKLRAYSLILRLYRFAQVKMKLGIEGFDDIKRLRCFRRWAGRNIDLRVDVNEAWKPAEVVQRIRELEPFGVTCVEQPVNHVHVNTLAEVRKQVSIPIMHDESLCSRVDAEHAIVNGTCDLFNLRLSKCGGYLASLELAVLARQHGLGYQLGCQVGETAILSAAGRHFASSVRDIRYLEGSFDRHLVAERLSVEDITFGWGGWAPALTGPGLGVTIDPAAIERVTVRKERLV
jgi:muconate cycloisomerase